MSVFTVLGSAIGVNGTSDGPCPGALLRSVTSIAPTVDLVEGPTGASQWAVVDSASRNVRVLVLNGGWPAASVATLIGAP